MKKQRTETPLASMLLRVPRPLKQGIDEAAVAEEISTAELTRYILRRWYEERMDVLRVQNDSGPRYRDDRLGGAPGPGAGPGGG